MSVPRDSSLVEETAKKFQINPQELLKWLTTKHISFDQLVEITEPESFETDAKLFVKVNDVDFYCDTCGEGCLDPHQMGCDYCDTNFNLCWKCCEIELPSHTCN